MSKAGDEIRSSGFEMFDLMEYHDLSAYEVKYVLSIIQDAAKVALKTEDLPNSWKRIKLSDGNILMGEDLGEAIFGHYHKKLMRLIG